MDAPSTFRLAAFIAFLFAAMGAALYRPTCSSRPLYERTAVIGAVGSAFFLGLFYVFLACIVKP